MSDSRADGLDGPLSCNTCSTRTRAAGTGGNGTEGQSGRSPELPVQLQFRGSEHINRPQPPETARTHRPGMEVYILEKHQELQNTSSAKMGDGQ